MKYSEFKEELENSLIYEFFGKIFNFLRQYKFMSILILIAFVSLALLFAPIIIRYSPTNDKQGSETILFKKRRWQKILRSNSTVYHAACVYCN